MTQSSPSSGIFFQGDGQSQMMITSLTSSSFGNSSNSVPGAGQSSLDPVSGDMNNAVLNSVANSGGHSVGASSLVTDANSSLSGRPHLQRSASINTESYMRLPASPLSFSSNNISISGSSVMDGSSVVQQSSPQDQNAQQMSQSQHSQKQQQQQHQPQGPSSVASLPMSQHGQVSLLMGARPPGCFIQDSYNLSHPQKKPRLDMKQEDIMQQQVLQQLLQRQGVMQLSGQNQQLQALIMQQRLRQQQQQQQLLQSMPQFQRAQLQRQQQEQQQQQLQLRQQLQQQSMQSLSATRPTCDVGVCARRLMQFLYHQRQRPLDSSIAYWRKFVAEYYSPRAKKRWCFSLYENIGNLRIGAFPQATVDSWHCDICGAKSGRGFEATFEILPRLNEIQFSSGVIDELLFLDLPREFRFPSGIMMLEYGKAVQESAYEQVRVVREGQLRIIFTQDLKILSWEFCARRHEELLARRLVAPQVNQLLQVAQKCQNTISESGPDGVSRQDLQTNSDMVLAAGRQLAKSLDLQSLNDLGFSKRYVRCFQIAEVVNSMKDLIGFSMDHKVGPIEGLKNFAQQYNWGPTLQGHKMQELEQLTSVQGLPTEWNALNKLMSAHPGLSNQVNSSRIFAGTEALGAPTQAATALTNYQNLLMRQNSNSSNTASSQQESSSYMSNLNQSPSTSFHVSAGLLPQSMLNLPVSGTSNPHLPVSQLKVPHQLQHNTLSNGNPLQLIPQSSPDNQAFQQQMIQQMLQGMSNNSAGVQQQSLGGKNSQGNMRQNTVGIASNGIASNDSATPGVSSNVSGSSGPATSRSNSFKGVSNSETTVGGNIRFSQKAADMPQTLPLQDDIVPNILDDFTDTGFFNIDLDDTMGYGWKA